MNKVSLCFGLCSLAGSFHVKLGYCVASGVSVLWATALHTRTENEESTRHPGGDVHFREEADEQSWKGHIERNLLA